MRKVTMTRVAEVAGVSVTTVSHVVNNTRVVAPHTRQAVLAAMGEVGFTPRSETRPARAQTETFGLVLPMVWNPYWHELIAGFKSEAERHGVHLLIADSAEDPEAEEQATGDLLAHGVQGVVIMPSVGWANAGLPMLRDSGTPFVVVDRTQPIEADQVGVENEPIVATLIDHLLHKGHRRIGLVAGIRGLPTTQERIDGYLRALRRRDVPVAEELIEDGESSEAGGRRAAHTLLGLPEPPTAIFAGNAAMTIGTLRAIQERGLKTPDDIAFVSFDDLPWADVFSPRITAVAQPSFAIGARAIQFLVKRIREPEAPYQFMRLNAEIVHRSSCGCVSGSEAD